MSSNTNSPYSRILKYFPSDWRKNADEKKLAEYLQQSKTNTLLAFFTCLDGNEIPTETQLKKAANTLRTALNNNICSQNLFEILNGNKAIDPQKIHHIVAHLNALMPAIETQHPITVQGKLSPTVLGMLVAAGTFLGFIFGGGIVGYFGNTPAETGHLFGTIIGAALSAVAALLIADNPNIRKGLQIGIGVFGVTRMVIPVLARSLVPRLLLPRGIPMTGILGKGMWLILFPAAFLITIMLKRTKAYDIAYFRETIELQIDQYLQSAFSIIAVLLKDDVVLIGDPSPDRELILKIVGIIQQDPTDIERIIQELKAQKYNTNPTTKTVIWNSADAEMVETYEITALIPDGAQCTIAKQPISQNGKILEQGRLLEIKPQQ